MQRVLAKMGYGVKSTSLVGISGGEGYNTFLLRRGEERIA